ncbi:hypothetical protein [Alteribacillus sp. HJP-4]
MCVIYTAGAAGIFLVFVQPVRSRSLSRYCLPGQRRIGAETLQHIT